MTTSKISVSLDAPLLAFVEQYQSEHSIRSKSEVISEAVMLLRERALEQQYADALAEWEQESAAWDVVSADGLAEEPRAEG